MRQLVFYGKGGVGKSTVVSNLALLFARAGRRVLLFGCDPKGDSCYCLVEGDVVTVVDRWREHGSEALRLADCIMPGRDGVDCLEAGGPGGGTGCDGRGITKALELVGDPDVLRSRYDVVLFDVLGDLVCGGFSAPMDSEHADEVYVVTSGELPSLCVANDVADAVRVHARSGVRLAGLVGNLRGLPGEAGRIERLARSIGSQLVHSIPHDPAVAAAEIERVPVVDFRPSSPAAVALRELHRIITGRMAGHGTVPKPLSRSQIDELFVAE